MTDFVTIVKGSYRNAEVLNTTFRQIKPFQSGANGNFVTVDGTALFGRPQVRIKVESLNDIMLANEGDETAPVVPTTAPVVEITETDDEIMARIGERFEILHDMARAACEGNVRAMIVTGPPGIGKSFGVEAELDRASLFDRVAGRRVRSEVVKGAATPIGLYQLLYKYSDPENVLVFDDSDMLFFDDISLNLLKSALDTGRRRKVCWNSESSALRREGIPESFDFKGSIIFITNLNFANIKSKKLQDHLLALESRCHYIDLTINTPREKLLRIKQIAATGELFRDYDFTPDQEKEVIDFLFEHKNRLREISLRTALKAADLYKSFPAKWKSFAETTIMKGAK